LSGFIALQVPLWIARIRYRWRLAWQFEDVSESLQDNLQFTLRHLLVAVFLISLALSPFRLVFPAENPGSWSEHSDTPGIFLAMISFNYVATIPCIWLAFLAIPKLIRLTLVWLVCCAILTAIVFGGLFALIGPPPRGELTLALEFYALCLSQGVAVLVGLLVLRYVGFRLVRMHAVKP
jgi:hypothetical protein